MLHYWVTWRLARNPRRAFLTLILLLKAASYLYSGNVQKPIPKQSCWKCEINIRFDSTAFSRVSAQIQSLKCQDFCRQRTLTHSVRGQCIPKWKKCMRVLKRNICTVKSPATIWNSFKRRHIIGSCNLDRHCALGIRTHTTVLKLFYHLIVEACKNLFSLNLFGDSIWFDLIWFS